MKIIISNKISHHNHSKILSVLKKSLNISNLNKTVIIECINPKKQDTYAYTKWYLRYGFKIPTIQLTEKLMKQSSDIIGYTLTHEFIHCRQGFWKILIQKIWFFITFKKCIPPFEIQAYNSINEWYKK